MTKNTTDIKDETYQYGISMEVLKLREIQAIETLAESLKSIAINFSTLVTMLEEDFKEEQAYRHVNERLKMNPF